MATAWLRRIHDGTDHHRQVSFPRATFERPFGPKFPYVDMLRPVIPYARLTDPVFAGSAAFADYGAP